jgi:hypothetical protein
MTTLIATLGAVGVLVASAGGEAPAKKEPPPVPANSMISVVNGHKGESRRCYEEQQKHGKAVEPGRVPVKLLIGADGTVTSVTTSPPPSLRATEPCLKKAIKAWKFPAASKGYQFEFPIVVPD